MDRSTIVLCDPLLASWLTSNKIDTAYGRLHAIRLKARANMMVGWTWPVVPDSYIHPIDRKTKRA